MKSRSVLFVALVGLVACGSKPSRKARKVCKQAAEQYVTCIGDLLGPEMAQAARNKDGIDACARDERTVEMYRTCLPRTECGEFLDCLENYALAATPTISADKPRPEQCAQHVRDGLRGIALQVVAVNEIERRSDQAQQRAQECLSDESRPWDECVEPPERVEVHRYGAERQRACEAWPEELALCVLRQPGATNCDPDSFPLWSLPIDQGAAGPPIAWTTKLVDDEDYGDDDTVQWAADGVLVVRDASGLRGIREGTELWKRDQIVRDFVIAGGAIVMRVKDDDPYGFHIHSTISGARATTVTGITFDAYGASGDRVLAQTLDNELYEITPAQCRGTRPCAKKLGIVNEDDALYTEEIGAWRDQVVMASSSGVLVTNRRGQTKLRISFDANDVALSHDGGVIISDDRGVAVLSLATCSKLGAVVELASTQDASTCIVAHRKLSWVASADPVELTPGAFAFNDHGIVERTQLFGPRTGSWSVETGGNGRVAGDEQHVYTVSYGNDGDRKVRLLALDRKTGKTAWSTPLPTASPDATDTTVIVRDGMLAVRVGPMVYVLDLRRA